MSFGLWGLDMCFEEWFIHTGLEVDDETKQLMRFAYNSGNRNGHETANAKLKDRYVIASVDSQLKTKAMEHHFG
jgi:hypothetical protein